MSNQKLLDWEKKLKIALDKLDDFLENKYAEKYRLHPVRPKRNATANKSHDGLFNITAKFSLGLGSKLGEGYSLDLRIASLENICSEFKQEIENESISFLRNEFKNIFKDDVKIAKDANIIKIYGNLSLD